MVEQKLDEKILENNTICIFGQIDEQLTSRVLKQILALQFKYREECILNPSVVVFINSCGGIVSGGLAICDALRSLKCKVVTVCIGQAASMAATILSSGTKGYRYMLANSETMIHQPLGGAQGQATDIEIQCAHIIETKRKLNKILAENTGKTIEQIRLDSERDFYMSPVEAQKYGLIDKILQNFSEVFDEISYK